MKFCSSNVSVWYANYLGCFLFVLSAAIVNSSTLESLKFCRLILCQNFMKDVCKCISDTMFHLKSEFSSNVGSCLTMLSMITF